MVKILIAPNSMKGSLSAFEFADIVERAFKAVSENFKIKKLPVADGGDFTGEILQKNLLAKKTSLDVTGPLGEKVRSKYAFKDEIAVIEMADASGMKLLDTNFLNPMEASSFGTGELIMDSIQKGCNVIYLAIGGSATVDGGMGMLEAMGFKFFNRKLEMVEGKGKGLSEVHQIQVPNDLPDVSFKIICDVDNPLLGKNGAAAVFGPQKGATPEMVVQLEKGLKNWAEVIRTTTGKKLKDTKGAGAAGGIAIPLLAFFNAEIVPGADFVLKQIGINNKVKWSDIVITGEGKIDSQTLNNKAPYAVSKVARQYNKPVFAIGGTVEKEASGVFDGMYSIVNGPMSLDTAMRDSEKLLYNLSVELAKTIQKFANCIK